MLYLPLFVCLSVAGILLLTIPDIAPPPDITWRFHFGAAEWLIGVMGGYYVRPGIESWFRR
jgi:hypothetical protein